MIKSVLYISFIYSFCFTQWFDLNHDGINRSYYISYPNDWTEPSGLIINMHGFGGTASNQQAGTQMNSYAHPQNMAVVYPQAIIEIGNPFNASSWNIGTFWDFNTQDDVGFISALIDDVASNFDIDLSKSILFKFVMLYGAGYIETQ